MHDVSKAATFHNADRLAANMFHMSKVVTVTQMMGRCAAVSVRRVSHRDLNSPDLAFFDITQQRNHSSIEFDISRAALTEMAVTRAGS